MKFGAYLMIGLFFFMTACSSGVSYPSTPKQVYLEYRASVDDLQTIHGYINLARQYGDEQMQAEVENLAAIPPSMTGLIMNELRSFSSSDIESIDEAIDGDAAALIVHIDGHDDVTVTMEREDGAWKLTEESY